MSASLPQPIVSAGTIWNEDTYHNTLPEVFVTPKNNQIGKKTLLQRVADSANSFLGSVKLPTVNVEHSVGSLGGGDNSKMMLYGALAIAAIMMFKNR